MPAHVQREDTYRRISPPPANNPTNEAYLDSRTRRRLTTYASRTGRPLDDADLVIGIDPASWPPNAAARVLAATTTAPRRVLLDPRPTKPDHPFALAIDAGGPGLEVHAPDPDADPFDPESWRATNPSIDHAPGLLEAIQREAAAARTSPLAQAAFRATRLNAGPDAKAAGVLCRPADWRACEVVTLPAPDGPCYLGIDLDKPL